MDEVAEEEMNRPAPKRAVLPSIRQASKVVVLEAVGRLVARQGAELVSYSFLVELSFLSGAKRLGPGKVHALLRY